ncbi:hypothetical protein [Helicobacter sp. 23-1045]
MDCFVALASLRAPRNDDEGRCCPSLRDFATQNRGNPNLDSVFLCKILQIV